MCGSGGTRSRDGASVAFRGDDKPDVLFEFAAVLSTSATLGIVAEAVGVPAPTATAVIAAAPQPSDAQLAWSTALDGRPEITPQIADLIATSPASIDTAALVNVATTPGTGVPRLPSPSDQVASPVAASVRAASAQESALAPAASRRARVDVETLVGLRGVNLLVQLTALPADLLHTTLEQHPELVQSLRSAPPPAAEVGEWWQRSATDGRMQLLDAAPELIGNLEGVPYPLRDTANRRLLDRTIADIEADLRGDGGRAAHDRQDSTLHMLQQVRSALEAGPGEPRRSLLSLDAAGEGRAAVAVGSIAHADNVTYLVPGMFFGVDARMADWADTAAVLAMDQRDWLQRVGRADETVAAVAWIGYETPTLLNVASMELARDGRDAFTSTIGGLAATRAADAPRVTVIAHSYGSAAAMLALQENAIEVDQLAIVGSPGSPARTVDDLHVRDTVWVGAADWDPIPWSGAFGSQPLADDYGAQRFSVAGGEDPVTGDVLSGAVSHNDYFTTGSESMRNFALIGIGEDALVTTAG